MIELDPPIPIDYPMLLGSPLPGRVEFDPPYEGVRDPIRGRIDLQEKTREDARQLGPRWCTIFQRH